MYCPALHVVTMHVFDPHVSPPAQSESEEHTAAMHKFRRKITTLETCAAAGGRAAASERGCREGAARHGRCYSIGVGVAHPGRARCRPAPPRRAAPRQAASRLIDGKPRRGARTDAALALSYHEWATETLAASEKTTGVQCSARQARPTGLACARLWQHQTRSTGVARVFSCALGLRA